NMASQQVSPTVPSASVIGNAFVHQYYNVLHQSPQMVFRFYNDSSKLGRPEPNGELSCITTMEAINEKIVSLDYGEYKAEIKTVDSQESFNHGVLVLVTGALLGKTVRRNFTQSFFLAPQEKGFFVLNDVFRYLEEPQQLEPRSGLFNGASDQAINAPPAEAVEELAPVQELHEAEEQAPQLDEELPVEEERAFPSEHEEGSGAEEEASSLETAEVVQSEQPVAADISVVPPEEAPKKSYASIVKVTKKYSSPVQAPAVVRTVSANVEWQAIVPTQSPLASEPLAPPSAPESSNSIEAEADGCSIYIKNLPLNATTTQLDEEFKKFGPIKPGGIQVRSNKQHGFCYGFVEFESSSSVQSAIEAAPIIGGRQAYVEEKRPAGSKAPRGRFQPGRGGFRNDVTRGRGGYGGRGYGR
ncbi:hypothetical protein KI387_030528, partial [Taxus chinensis]